MKRFAGEWIQIRTEYLELCGLPLYLNAIATETGIVLLDSGVADTPATSLAPELAAAGLRIADVALVVNSHAHPDHMGGNGSLRELADPRFAAPAAEAAWLEDNDQVIRELWNAHPEAFALDPAERRDVEALLGRRVRIDQLLREGDQLEAGGPLTIVTTSGHSPGHIAVHDQQRGVLFTFDDVQGHGVPIAHTQTLLAPLYHDVDRYLWGLRKLAALDFELMVPAHGEHLDRPAALARISASIEYVEKTDAFVSDYVRTHREIRLRELALALGTDAGPYGGVNLQTVSTARAHLEHQVHRGDLDEIWRSPKESA